MADRAGHFLIFVCRQWYHGLCNGQIVAVSVVKVVESLTMKHTVNQGLRIVRSSCSGPGRGTHHLVMQCADQFPQLWHCAVTPSYPSKGLLNSAGKRLKMSHRNLGIAELTMSSECDTKVHVCGMVGFGKVSIGAGV